MENWDSFFSTAWADHGTQPDAVAQRLVDILPQLDSPTLVAPFSRLVVHVQGEHLGHWSEGIALLEQLRTQFGTDPTLERSSAVLHYASGNPAPLSMLPRDERIAGLAVLSTLLANRGDFADAIAAYDDALARAWEGLSDGSPALRSLAVGGNNLACALEEKPDRSPDETRAMVTAAEGGLTYWKREGGWLEEERAEYRLCRSLLHAGEPQAALAHAERCHALCRTNDAPAFERFFAEAVLALAQHAVGNTAASQESCARAHALYAEIPTEEQPWCQSDLAELDQPDPHTTPSKFHK